MYQIVHGLKKEGYIDRNEVDSTFSTTDKRYTGRKNRLPSVAIKRGTREKPVTVDTILEVLANAKKPMLTFNIGTALGLKSKNKQRPKITRFLRNQMIADNLVTVNERAGGKSTYEITDLGREKLDNVKVITTVLEGAQKKVG